MFGLFKKTEVYYKNHENWEIYSTNNASVTIYKDKKEIEEFRSYVKTMIFIDNISEKNIKDYNHVISMAIDDYKGYSIHTYKLIDSKMIHVIEKGFKGQSEYKHIKKAISTGNYINLSI